jgi:hypothetical protein
LAEDQKALVRCEGDPDVERQIEGALAILDNVKRMLTEAAATFCSDGDDMDTYSDGRRVTSQLEMETGTIFEHQWHPQPDHRDNRPHTLLDRALRARGIR